MFNKGLEEEIRELRAQLKDLKDDTYKNFNRLDTRINSIVTARNMSTEVLKKRLEMSELRLRGDLDLDDNEQFEKLRELGMAALGMYRFYTIKDPLQEYRELLREIKLREGR